MTELRGGSSEVRKQNACGEWVPNTPVPFYEKRPLRKLSYICQCGARFKSEHRYNEHWQVNHR